jgi:hypothetical protein
MTTPQPQRYPSDSTAPTAADPARTQAGEAGPEPAAPGAGPRPGGPAQDFPTVAQAGHSWTTSAAGPQGATPHTGAPHAGGYSVGPELPPEMPMPGRQAGGPPAAAFSGPAGTAAPAPAQPGVAWTVGSAQSAAFSGPGTAYVTDAVPAPVTQAAPVADAVPAPVTQAAPVADAVPAPVTQAAPVADAVPAPVTQAAPVADAVPAPVTQAAPVADAVTARATDAVAAAAAAPSSLTATHVGDRAEPDYVDTPAKPGRPHKSMLALAAIAGTLLIAVPVLVTLHSDHDKAPARPKPTPTNPGTVLGGLAAPGATPRHHLASLPSVPVVPYEAAKPFKPRASAAPSSAGHAPSTPGAPGA